jgi:hypothetical protein
VPLVTVVRVIDVDSAVTVTVALGITPPVGSVTSPVMPPSVCCDKSDEQHSATIATIASNRGNADGRIRIKGVNWLTSKGWITFQVANK